MCKLLYTFSKLLLTWSIVLCYYVYTERKGGKKLKKAKMQENKKLKLARIEKGLYQKDMADKLGISRLSYLLKENGERDFTEWEIMKICEILEKSPEDLFFKK